MFSPNQESVIYLSMTDENHPLSASANFEFELDGKLWPSVMHYFHASKFSDENLMEDIRVQDSLKAIVKEVKKHKRQIRSDWESIQSMIMTRAVYVKCRTHPVVGRALLKTGDAKIFENSQYDYFWGCGRDLRGKNTFGQILMDVRSKLKELEVYS